MGLLTVTSHEVKEIWNVKCLKFSTALRQATENQEVVWALPVLLFIVPTQANARKGGLWKTTDNQTGPLLCH